MSLFFLFQSMFTLISPARSFKYSTITPTCRTDQLLSYIQTISSFNWNGAAKSSSNCYRRSTL